MKLYFNTFLNFYFANFVSKIFKVKDYTDDWDATSCRRVGFDWVTCTMFDRRPYVRNPAHMDIFCHFRDTLINLCEILTFLTKLTYPTNLRTEDLSLSWLKKHCRDFYCCRSEWAWRERTRQLSNRQKLHYRGIQSLFLIKRKELWLCATERFRMRNGLARNCGYR